MKKIVLISSGQPSVNPRLVKEANALTSGGYEVSVIYSFWTHWACQMDEKLFSSVPWTPILVGGSPYKNKLTYFSTRLRFKLANILAQKFTLKFGIAEMAKGRASVEMLRKAKSIKADFYIAHNLAALPVAIKAAAYHKAKCGFDAEDFHRQEVSDSTEDFNYRISSFLEDKYFPRCDYLTAASPLIAKAYQQLFPKFNLHIINNVFEVKHIRTVPYRADDKLKLFWFSQTIGKNRGLEDVINALNILRNDAIELHLLGNSNKESEAYFNCLVTDNKNNLHFHKPIMSEEIFKFASQFDVGLALEPGFCYNNKIALSNKLFSYLISGLALIVSDTAAQKAFIEENEGIGFAYPTGNITELADKIDFLFMNRTSLMNCKIKSSILAMEKYNWKIESGKFLTIISNNLG